MTSMRRHYVASTSLRRHVPAGNLAPLGPSLIFLTLPPPQYSKPSYAYENYSIFNRILSELNYSKGAENIICTTMMYGE